MYNCPRNHHDVISAPRILKSILVHKDTKMNPSWMIPLSACKRFTKKQILEIHIQTLTGPSLICTEAVQF